MDEFSSTWTKPCIRIGRITYLAVMLFSFAPNIYLLLFHGAKPATLEIALSAWAGAAITYGAFYFVEPFSYYPILGLAGTYMGVVSGNIANVRLPASATAQEAVGVENGTKEAELVSTLGISGSIITNLLLITIAAVIGGLILAALPAVVQMALQSYVLPSIFGAMVGQFAVQKPLIAVYAFVTALLMKLLFPSLPAFVFIIVAVFGNMIISRVLYKKGALK